MEVTLSDNAIQRIRVDASGETSGIADEVFKRLPAKIVKGQTLNVDTVAGATISSRGVVDGVAEAITLAGGEATEWKQRAKPEAATQAAQVEEYQTDVVVVGAGGAGLAAATRSLQHDKQVVILEKFPQLGGNTTRAGGPMNAADPDWQRGFTALTGEKETLEQLANTPLEQIDPEYRTDFERLREQIKEYIASGAQYLFDSNLLHEIQTYLGGKREDLAGHEIHGQYQLVKTLVDNALDSVKWLADLGVKFDQTDVTMPVGALWQRGHKPVEPMGYAFIHVLGDWVTEYGATILTETRAENLLMENGRVVGVVAHKTDGTKVTVRAKSVFLTAGGFGANTPMVQKYNTYWKHIDDDIATTNSPAITGDGISLGQEAGAELTGMGFIQLMPVSDPATGELFTGLQTPPENFIMVNQEGKRFVNEFAERDTLEDTINKYNSYVDAGHDPEFGKSAFHLKCEVAPFYATPRKPAIHHTMGGLAIDEYGHVLDKAGQVIAGLYSAGENAGGLHAGNRLGGNSLADIFTFGRLAADTAAQENG